MKKVVILLLLLTVTAFAGEGTFGFEDVGGTGTEFSADYKEVCEFTLSEDGDVYKISFYSKTSIGTAATKAVIYSDSDPNPDALLGTSAEVTITTTEQWYDFTFSPPISLTGGNNYYLGHISGDGRYRYYNSGGTNQNVYNEDEYDDGATNPFGTPSNLDREFSIYATYTTGGGGRLKVRK
jgi:hypothetical protein